MRFIAILNVLLSHSIAVLPERFYVIHRVIFDGVLVFFVLSGFLIGRIFIKDFESQISINKIFVFWKRRWLRTLPAYFFTILLIILLSKFLGRELNFHQIIKNLFFIQNLTYHYGYFFIESWSLSIEEWFYLTLPLFVLFLNSFFKGNLKLNLIIISILTIITSLFIRYFISLNVSIETINDWDKTFRSPIITRLDSLMIGVIGACFYQYKNQEFFKYKNILFIIGAIIFIVNRLLSSFDLINVSDLYLKVFYLTVAPFSILCMLPYVYYLKPIRNKFINALIVKGSLISYSLYLLNLTVVSFLLLQPLRINYWYKFLLFWILSIFLSILIYKYIEVPFMKFRDRK